MTALSERVGVRPVYLVLLTLTAVAGTVGWAIPRVISDYRSENDRQQLAAELVPLADEASLLASTENIDELTFQDSAMDFAAGEWTVSEAVGFGEATRLLGIAGDAGGDALQEAIAITADERAAEVEPPYGAEDLSAEELADLEALKLCFRTMAQAQDQLLLAMERAEPDESIEDTIASVVYAACAVGDVAHRLELGTSLAPDALAIRRNALSVLRRTHPLPPKESPLGATLDGLILEQNRAVVAVRAESAREPSPVLASLRSAQDAQVRRGAFVRVWRERAARIEGALEDFQPVAPRLRRALMDAGLDDPQGGVAEYLEESRQFWEQRLREEEGADGALGDGGEGFRAEMPPRRFGGPPPGAFRGGTAFPGNPPKPSVRSRPTR